MKHPVIRWCSIAAFFCAATFLLCGATKTGPSPFREYPGWEYEAFQKPPDWQVPGEWVFARLMYPAIPTWGYRGNPDWKHGAANWTIDYPRSDRHLLQGMRRLTRIDTRSVEQVVDPLRRLLPGNGLAAPAMSNGERVVDPAKQKT